MPAQKRKRDSKQTSTPFEKPPILLLPPEIRLKIYKHLFFSTDFDPLQSSDCVTLSPFSKRMFRMDRKASRQERRRLFPKHSLCNHPLSHQTLLLICRQIYNEFWPLYLTHHSTGFDHPIKFANEYLSFQPIDRLKMIKHLSLTIVSSSSSYDLAWASATRDIIRDVDRLFDHYPELLANLLSFTWEVHDRRRFNAMVIDDEAETMYLKLLQILSSQRRRERSRREAIDATQSEQPTKPLKKWRTGFVIRGRGHSGHTIDWFAEHAFMVYFEKLPIAGPHCDRCAKGLRFVKAKDWTEEPPHPQESGSDPSAHSSSIGFVEKPTTPPYPYKMPLYAVPVMWSVRGLSCDSDRTTPVRGVAFDITI